MRVDAAIGHIPLGKLRPHHIDCFCSNLAETGIKKVTCTAVARDLQSIVMRSGITRNALAKAAGVAPVTITKACRQERICKVSADKIAVALGMDTNNLFQLDSPKEGLSQKTIRHHYSLICSILESAVKLQVIYDNPARRVNPPRVEKKEAAYLDDKQAVCVVNALMQSPIKWKTIVMLLMHSGMRRGEACGLVWDDLDFESNLVHITKANQYLAGKGIFEKDPKTSSSVRVIKLPDVMFSMLCEYRAWHVAGRLKMGDRWQDSGKVFTQENGDPLHPDSITGWMASFRNAYNLPYFTPHTLRHTNATLLIMQGIPIKAVSARLGHASQNTTNAVYSHAIQTVDAMASDVIGEVLSKNNFQDSNLTKTSQPS